MQILHEACHGVCAVLVGAQWQAFNYVGFFWAFFLAAYWLEVKAPVANPSRLPDRVSLTWGVGAVLALAVAVAVVVLVPTLWFV